MKRVSDPEIRRNQILETAMRLFYEKGYENTSLEDIAGELHVVKSLCYRYFDSKQALFETVLDEYAEECCRDFVEAIHDRSLDFGARMEKILGLMLSPGRFGRYHDFFHKSGNEAMHERLSMRICGYMIPHVAQELALLSADEPEATARFLTGGMIGVWQGDEDGAALSRRFAAIMKALKDGKVF